MQVTPDASSFMMSMGGQGNAAGWSVRASGVLAVPDATYGRSGYTVLLVTWGAAGAGATQPPMHRLAGQRIRCERLGELEVGASGLRLEHPALSVEIPGVPAGRWSASFEAFACDPQGFSATANEDHFVAVVTLWIRLTPAGEAEAEVKQDGSSLALYVNELGFVLCDAPRVDRILAARRDEIEDAGGILEAIGATMLGEDLIDDGAFFPIWGMRPWLYRIATLGAGSTLCPVGRALGDIWHFRSAGFTSGIRVIPGSSLRGAAGIEWDRWPLLDLPGKGDGLQLATFVSGGPEPIDPEHSVGILSTLWIARTADVPAGANSAQYALTGYDPLPRYQASDAPERASRAGGV